MTRWRTSVPADAIERLDSERGCWAALGVAMVLSTTLGLWLTRGTTFFADELTFSSLIEDSTSGSSSAVTTAT